jgi:hypothetical protein
MTRTSRRTAVAAALATVAIGAGAAVAVAGGAGVPGECDGSGQAVAAAAGAVQGRGPAAGLGNGRGPGARGGQAGLAGIPPAGTLSSAERAGILRMREEEKMARDVYLRLARTSGNGVFTNIARSESQHMATMRFLVDRYDLKDPVAGKARGEFTSAAIQRLYDTSVASGAVDEVAALRTGALIEEQDIADLNTAIRRTNNADLKTVYRRLRAASGNHLRAFTRQLSQQGVVYTPQVLSPSLYSAYVR